MFTVDDFIITAFCMIDDTMKQLFADHHGSDREALRPLSQTARLSPWR